MVTDPVQFLQSLGLPQILLWLLSFAILYGLLEQVQIPKSKMSRALISLVIAFFIILAAPLALIDLLSQMSGALILVVLGILILVVFLEVAGAKSTILVEKEDEKGNIQKVPAKISIFHRYGYLFGAVILIAVALIFVSAGGLEILGISMPEMSASSPGTLTIFFFIAIIAAIAWMIANPE
ncbi:MAG: hypothetical protein ISS95_01090 [Candidatus Aenigmarchaeota archaeon]|nr:hypothetical protein [Candidatus Aenigmarchaeota archaeon]